MERSKIEWTDYTWNPVTGCLHHCPYCYAEKMSARFCGDIRYNRSVANYTEKDGLYVVKETVKSGNGRALAFPFGFAPTLHENRLDGNCKPLKIMKPFHIFVCSVADLWGDWVPDEWIERVMNVCIGAPRHTYLFLTKNPKRYVQFVKPRYKAETIKNMWFGITITADTKPAEVIGQLEGYNTFLSIEPLQAAMMLNHEILEKVKWVIVGAETGQRKEKVIPERDWIKRLVSQCRGAGVPIFLKNNIASVWKRTLIQQLPDELERNSKND